MATPLSAATLSPGPSSASGRGWWAVAAGTVLTLGMTVTTIAHAAVQLERTRVLITQKDGSASINASNTAKQPVLLQVWVEEGEAARGKIAGVQVAARPDAQVPFIVDPPVLRLNPGESRALQVWLSQKNNKLPEDRESQFWLNVLEVPAVEINEDGQTEQTGNRLDISIVTRIKVLWRPEKLMRPNYQWTGKDDLWLALEKDDNNQYWLVLNNPSPFHLSVDKLTVYEGDRKAEKKDKTEIPAPVQALMLLPFGKQKIRLANAPAKPETVHAVIVYIGDWGELLEMEPLAVKVQQE